MAKEYQFQTAVHQLLQIVIHSLYSNKEIFLRELVSNASDALDKLRFLAIDNPALLEGGETLRVRVLIDADKKQLKIIDNGIGMSEEEIIQNLGTIARSGTKEFVENLSKSGNDAQRLIGQFGVGFYSSFIVADEVVVKSRRAGLEPSQGVVWTSKGDGQFTIDQETRSEHGTEIILSLKDDANEFLEPWRLRSLIHKYSDHIAFPHRNVKRKHGEKK